MIVVITNYKQIMRYFPTNKLRTVIILLELLESIILMVLKIRADLYRVFNNTDRHYISSSRVILG